MFDEDYIKTCPSCQDDFEAKRTNQVYCTPTCKSRYHNGNARHERQNLESRKTVTGGIDEILWTNRTVLKKYKGTKQKIADIQEEGFKLNYITYFTVNKENKNILYVYDTYYVFDGKENILIY